MCWKSSSCYLSKRLYILKVCYYFLVECVIFRCGTNWFNWLENMHDLENDVKSRCFVNQNFRAQKELQWKKRASHLCGVCVFTLNGNASRVWYNAHEVKTKVVWMIVCPCSIITLDSINKIFNWMLLLTIGIPNGEIVTKNLGHWKLDEESNHINLRLPQKRSEIITSELLSEFSWKWN